MNEILTVAKVSGFAVLGFTTLLSIKLAISHFNTGVRKIVELAEWKLTKEEGKSKCKLKLEGPLQTSPFKVEIFNKENNLLATIVDEKTEFYIVDKFEGEIYARVHKNEKNEYYTTSSIHVNTENFFKENLMECIEEKFEKKGYFAILFVGGKGGGKTSLLLTFLDFFVETGYTLVENDYRSPRSEFHVADSNKHVTTKFLVARLEKTVNNKTIVIELIDSPGLEIETKHSEAWYEPMKEKFGLILEGKLRVNTCIEDEKKKALESCDDPKICIPKANLTLVCYKHGSTFSGNEKTTIEKVITSELKKTAIPVCTKVDEDDKWKEISASKVPVFKYQNGILNQVSKEALLSDYPMENGSLPIFCLTKRNLNNFNSDESKKIVKMLFATFVNNMIDMYNAP